MVTAEAAVVLPLLALVALALVWLVSIGIAQVRVVDAARDAARAVARGDDSDAAVRAARRTAGRDSVVRITTSGGLVSVDVSERVAAPGWLLAPLPPVTVRSTSRIGAEGEPEAR
jgi:Flp pilus assembly protein TadG